MKTYEQKYDRRVGWFVELNIDGKSSIAERGAAAMNDHKIKEKYESQGFVEKTSETISMMREALADADTEEKKEILETVTKAVTR